MAQWKKFSINIQNIQHETAAAYLISLPHKSDYDGFTFWVSKKLVRPGNNAYEMALSVCEGMEFQIKRVSEKTRAVLEEKKISAEELIEAFGGILVHYNREKQAPYCVVTRVPDKLEPRKQEANETLKR